jgi:signal transduction histidine kinase
MSIIALTDAGDLRRPVLAWVSIGIAGAWTLWLTVPTRGWDRTTLWLDLFVCCWLISVSALVVFDGEVVSGRAFFATGYPVSAALAWGVRYGPRGGLLAGGILSGFLVLTRPLNAVPLGDLSGGEIRDIAGGVVNYLLAGGAVGIVSLLLIRSAEALESATAALVLERERAARLAERESLARQIHDSVLQALALIHKRGRELARRSPIPAAEVASLSELAGREEVELRGLILREPADVPEGRISLRAELESLARSFDELDVTVSSVGPVWCERAEGQELVAAVRQGLTNVEKHARASHATVFVDGDERGISLSLRDDGAGFVYDETKLRADGKAGLLKSMKGRVEDLGGSMIVTTAPGKGTEIEFFVPSGGAGAREGGPDVNG